MRQVIENTGDWRARLILTSQIMQKLKDLEYPKKLEEYQAEMNDHLTNHLGSNQHALLFTAYYFQNQAFSEKGDESSFMTAFQSYSCLKSLIEDDCDKLIHRIQARMVLLSEHENCPESIKERFDSVAARSALTEEGFRFDSLSEDVRDDLIPPHGVDGK